MTHTVTEKTLKDVKLLLKQCIKFLVNLVLE